MDNPPKHPDVAAIFGRLLSELGLSANQLAAQLATSQQAISNYVIGRNKPGGELLAAIVTRYPAINSAWLLTGKGEPFPNGRALAPASPAPAPLRLNTDGESESYWKALAADRLEQLRAATEREKWLQGQFQELVGKSPASAYTAESYAKNAAISLRPTACQLATMWLDVAAA